MTRNELQLGPLEMEIVGLLDGRDALSVSDIRDRLTRNGKDLAYTTVMTVLGRLHTKGVLTRHKSGKQYLYSYAHRAQQVRMGVVGKVQRALFGGDGLKPIMRFLEQTDGLTADELRELKSLINEKIKRAEKSGPKE